jgi:hypothetical protein
MDANGDHVIVWEKLIYDSQQLRFDYEIQAQRYDRLGAPLGTEFRVNTTDLGPMWWPTAAMDADGDFLVAWSSAGANVGDHEVVAQRYDAAGQPRDGEFRLNTVAKNTQLLPWVAMTPGDGWPR